MSRLLQQPIPILVREVVSPLHLPPPQSSHAIFTVVATPPPHVLAVGRIVQLQISSAVPSNEGSDTRPPARSRRHRKFAPLNLAFCGPIVGVRWCGSRSVEFIARNAILEEDVLRYAHLRVPYAEDVPGGVEFAHELTRRLEALPMKVLDGDETGTGFDVEGSSLGHIGSPADEWDLDGGNVRIRGHLKSLR